MELVCQAVELGESWVQSGALLRGFRSSFLRGRDSAPCPGAFQIASAKQAAGCGGVDHAAIRAAAAVGAQFHAANGSTGAGKSGFGFLAQSNWFFFWVLAVHVKQFVGTFDAEESDWPESNPVEW